MLREFVACCDVFACVSCVVLVLLASLGFVVCCLLLYGLFVYVFCCVVRCCCLTCVGELCLFGVVCCVCDLFAIRVLCCLFVVVCFV